MVCDVKVGIPIRHVYHSCKKKKIYIKGISAEKVLSKQLCYTVLSNTDWRNTEWTSVFFTQGDLKSYCLRRSLDCRRSISFSYRILRACQRIPSREIWTEIWRSVYKSFIFLQIELLLSLHSIPGLQNETPLDIFPVQIYKINLLFNLRSPEDTCKYWQSRSDLCIDQRQLKVFPIKSSWSLLITNVSVYTKGCMFVM